MHIGLQAGCRAEGQHGGAAHVFDVEDAVAWFGLWFGLGVGLVLG